MKALIAEDDNGSRAMLEASLKRWGYDVVSCRDGAEAWSRLAGAAPPPLAILDWQMPHLDGVEVCRRIRARSDVPYTYVILVSGWAQREHVAQGLEAGADDYILKPIDSQELQLRVRAGRRILDLHAALYAASERLRIQAAHDPLTELWNHVEALAILARELERGRREGRSTAVLMADIDHFKSINDRYGHIAGDDVLKETAVRLAKALRPYDTIGRYGGEEFLIVLPGAGADAAAQLGERVRRRIVAKPFSTSEGDVAVTMSIGVAAIESARGRDAVSLIRAADAALYQAKRAGRNCVELAPVAEHPLPAIRP